MEKRLYTVKKAAVYLGRTDWGVRGLIWRGRLPEVRDGRKIYIDIKDLDRYIERNKRIIITQICNYGPP